MNIINQQNHYSEWAKLWNLDPSMMYLNHGSFGACPTAILQKQTDYRNKLESEPVRFLIREIEELFFQAKKSLSDLIHANDEDVAFVPNATHGVNTVLRSLHFNKDDEILITNQIYPACRNAVNYVADLQGAKVIEVNLDYPIESEDMMIEQVLNSITTKTKLLLIDHIASPTAIIFPVKQLADKLRGEPVDILVDGAHAPGSIPLDLSDLNVAYYTGNCHKWLCTPKSAAFLFVRKDRQQEIFPLSISHWAVKNADFQSKFFWTGTYDPTPYLCVKDAIEFLGGLFSGGIVGLMQRNHNLLLEARNLICDRLQIPHPCPDSMMAAMCSFPLPPLTQPPLTGRNYIDPLQEKLFRENHIEIPVIMWPNPLQRLIRISVQAYNTLKQYEILAEILYYERDKFVH